MIWKWGFKDNIESERNWNRQKIIDHSVIDLQVESSVIFYRIRSVHVILSGLSKFGCCVGMASEFLLSACCDIVCIHYKLYEIPENPDKIIFSEEIHVSDVCNMFKFSVTHHVAQRLLTTFMQLKTLNKYMS